MQEFHPTVSIWRLPSPTPKLETAVREWSALGTRIELIHQASKRPRHAGWPDRHEQPLTSAEIDAIFNDDGWGTAPTMVGLVVPKHALVVDIDNKPEDGLIASETLAEFVDAYGLQTDGEGLPLNTPIVRTPGQGLHLLYSLPHDLTVTNGVKVTDLFARNLDLKASGRGFLVAAPSVRPDGRAYQWLRHQPVAPLPPEDFLGDLREREAARQQRLSAQPSGVARPYTLGPNGTHPYVAAAFKNILARFEAAAPGTRNRELDTAAMQLAQFVAGGELPESETQNALRATSAYAAHEQSSGACTAERTLMSGWRKGLLEPRNAPPPQPFDWRAALDRQAAGFQLPSSQRAGQAEAPARTPIRLVHPAPAFPEAADAGSEDPWFSDFSSGARLSSLSAIFLGPVHDFARVADVTQRRTPGGILLSFLFRDPFTSAPTCTREILLPDNGQPPISRLRGTPSGFCILKHGDKGPMKSRSPSFRAILAEDPARLHAEVSITLADFKRFGLPTSGITIALYPSSDALADASLAWLPRSITIAAPRSIEQTSLHSRMFRRSNGTHSIEYAVQTAS